MKTFIPAVLLVMSLSSSVSAGTQGMLVRVNKFRGIIGVVCFDGFMRGAHLRSGRSSDEKTTV